MSSESSPSPEDLRQSALATATVRLLPGRYPPAYPVPLRCGVPIAKGKLTGDENAWLLGPTGEVVRGQTEALCHWSDGSARWMQIDVILPATNQAAMTWTAAFVEAPRTITVEYEAPGSVADLDIQLTFDEPLIVLRSGQFRFKINTKTGDSRALLSETGEQVAAWTLPTVTKADGTVCRPAVGEMQMSYNGLLPLTLEFPATYPQLRGLKLMVRQRFFSGTGLVQTEIAWHNPHRAKHAGGLWDLGDAGSIFFDDASWTVNLSPTHQTYVDCRFEPLASWQSAEKGTIGVHQESSGGVLWDSINHVDQTKQVPSRYQGGQVHNTGVENVLRLSPSLRIRGSMFQLLGTVPKFWQQFPKAIIASESQLRFGLFPESADQLYELQGGERKTHTVWLKFDPPESRYDLSWVHDPPRLVPVLGDEPVVPGWPRLTKLDARPISRLNDLCDEVLNGPASVYARREEHDEYGWRNFGEFFADHETVYYQGDQPLISHYNNQYDVLGGLLLQGLRTDNRQWWELAEDLMRHVTDIDLYHTQEDRAVYNGGLFWPTDHYTSCGTATHRTFSKLCATPGKPFGGGPACEHNYTTGLLAYYWLTGEPAARVAVIQLADWVIAMDDGRKTIFSLVDDGPTGSATVTTQANYHGPGRGAGNSINALLDAWLLTGTRSYLSAVEHFLRRCIHPADDVASRDLLNFELRWSYTVFLMALFKYLQCKEELGEFDDHFEYARQSLLHYARWMVDHERPYFDRAEQMEFPTETWGAQELRKANALRWAAAYAGDDALRTRLQQRGDEFAERAWHDLCRFPTRTFIRPFTLAMIQGMWDAALRSEIPVSQRTGTAPASWGEPARFLGQKARVKQMLKSPRGICTAMARAFDPRRWFRFLDAVRRML